MGVVGRSGGAFAERRSSPIPLEMRPVMRRPGNANLYCTGCSRWRRSLYEGDDGRWVCARCNPSDYLSRHEGASDPARAAMLLRRRLGCAPEIFGPLPPRPTDRVARREHVRLVRSLAILEARAFNHLRRFAESFEKLAAPTPRRRRRRGREPDGRSSEPHAGR